MDNLRIDFRPDFFLGLCFCFLLLPFALTLSWITAAIIHELAHYAVLRLTKTRIYSIHVGLGGAFMETAPMTCGKELACALAGPLSGLLLILGIKWLPLLAICGAMQAAYNLLPLFPLDGGRVLQCLLKKAVLPYSVYRWIETTVFVLLAFGALYLTFKLSIGPLPLIAVVILYVKVKLSCKQTQQAIQ